METTSPPSRVYLTPKQMLDAKTAALRDAQDRINSIDGMRARRTAIEAVAAATVAEYPQYLGSFALRTPVKVASRLQTKLGLAFRPGDYSITKGTHWSGSAGVGTTYHTVWSIRNGCWTSVPASDVEVIG